MFAIRSERLLCREVKVNLACPWRIRKFPQNEATRAMFVSSRRHRATVQIDDSPTHTRRPPARHYCQTPAARWSTCRRGRIRIAETPVGHQQPHAAAGAEPQFVRSLRFGSWITVRLGKPTPQASRRPEAQDLVEIPRGA